MEITKELIRSWTGAEMRKQLAGPNRDAIIKVIQGLNFSEVEQIQDKVATDPATETVVSDEQAEKDALAKQEADRVAAAQALVEEQRKQAEAAEAAKPKKFVIDYQVKDDEGNPIGRPTHLEAASQEELQGKIIEAHVQATRAFHRLKKQKVSFKNQPAQDPAVVAPKMTDAEILAAASDLKSQDSAVAIAAERKLLQEERRKAAEEREANRQAQVSYQFLSRHRHDFNNCQANVNQMAEYLQENDLEWTLDNLEIALHALESKLAPVEEPVAPAASVNPAPAVTPPSAPVVVAPVVQAPTTLVEPTPSVNPTPAQPRPGVNSGIVPGETSAPRPAATQQKTDNTGGLSLADIRSWDAATMRTKMRNPQLRAQIEAVLANRGAK